MPHEGRGGQVGHGGADPLHQGALVRFGGLGLGAVGADDVRGGRTEQFAAPDSAGRRDALDGALGAADRGEYLLFESGAPARSESAAVAVPEQRHGLGGAHQQVRGQAPGGQDAREVLGGGTLVPQQP